MLTYADLSPAVLLLLLPSPPPPPPGSINAEATARRLWPDLVSSITWMELGRDSRA